MSNSWKRFGIAGLVLAFITFQVVNFRTSHNSVPAIRKPANTDRSYKRSANVEWANSLILGVQTKEDISKVVQQILQKDMQVNTVASGARTIRDEGLRAYAIAASVVPYFEGSVYRLRNVVEKNKVIYLPAISALRGMKYASVYSPKFYDAGFEFLTKPNLGQDILGCKGPFKDIAELQTFATQKIAVIITNALGQLEALINNGDANRVIFISDLALVLGKDEADRVRQEYSDKDVSLDKIILAGHLKSILASGYDLLGVTYYVGSFHLDGVDDFATKIVTQSFQATKGRWLTNIAGDISDLNNIPSPKEKARFFREVRRSSPDFLKINNNANVNLSKSWNAFKRSAQFDGEYHQFLFDIAGRLASPDSYIVNADLIKDNEHEVMELVNKRIEIFSQKGSTTIKTATHRSLDVNVSVFFDPNKVADLGNFIPQKFYGDVADKSGRVPSGAEVYGTGHDRYEWNYNYGRPMMWGSPSFNGLFDASTKQSEVGQRVSDVMLYPPLNHLGAMLSLFI